MFEDIDVSKLSRDYSKEPLKKGERPTKEDLEYLYLELNLGRNDISTFLGCGKSLRNIKKFLKEYEIKKDFIKASEVRKNYYLSKFGVTSSFGVEETRKKIEETNLEKYGNRNPSFSSSIKTKRKDTFMSHFGVDNPSKCKEIKDKVSNTCLSRYGVTNYTKTDEYKEKCLESNLKKYGSEHYSKTEDFRNRIKKTCLAKYGVENVAQSNDVKEKARSTSIAKYGVSSFSKTSDFKQAIEATCSEKYGVLYPCLTDNCRKASLTTISKVNQKWKDFIKAEDMEFPVERYSFDLKIGNTLIEINPTYTHNSTRGTYFKGNEGNPLPKDYHRNKSEVAARYGYRCVHVFDWDDKEKIKHLVTESSNVIYARKCQIKEVSKEDTYSFLLKYHMQGNTSSFKVSLGLYYNEELVEIMTFGKPRYNKNYQYELLRLCTKFDFSVIGGASKLFTFFINNYGPENLISYCDLAKFSGDVYKNLGFELERTSGPTRHWYNGKEHITDNLLRSLGFDKLFNTSFGKGTSNEELMREAGFVEIYDCGQQTWIWKREE